MYRSLASYTKSGVQYVWEATWDEDGNRIEIETPVEPYLFYEDTNADNTYKSMFGVPMRKMTFKSQWERKQWINTSKNVPLFEKLSPNRQYLLNKYLGREHTPEFSKFPFRIFNLDIEIEIDGCFPDPQYADFPINVISIYDTLTNSVIVWSYNKNIDNIFPDSENSKIIEEIKKYDKDPKVIFCKFDKEHEMLENFLTYWEHNYPDIITGWNINKFDIIYIINRIIKILGEGEQYRLSPIKSNRAIYTTFEHDLNATIYKIQGVNICDYLDLYKKFAGTSRQSFKLDYIAKLELGIGKLDYYDLGYESMQEFMRNDFPTFVQYNIIDTVLIKLMDDKLNFITLMRNVCNIGLVEYESIFRSIPYILGALVIQARKNNTYFLTDSNKSDEKKDESEGFTGAFVYPTKAGYYKHGVMSFDFNSLYPNVMMTINISPDTKVGKVISELTDDNISIRKTNGKIITISKNTFNDILENKCTLSANNVLYIKPNLKFGIIPQFLDTMYKERVKVKSECKKNLKKVKVLEQTLNDLISKNVSNNEIDKLKIEIKNLKTLANAQDLKQHAFKIFLNSSYGALGSAFYPCFDLDNAEAVTLSGQTVTKEMVTYTNKILNELAGTTTEEHVIAGDTDSLYVKMDAVIQHIFKQVNVDWNIKEKFELIKNFVDNKFQQQLNNYCADFICAKFHTDQRRIEFKREKLSAQAEYTAKKRYIVHVYDNEGIPCNKWSYTGVDIKKNELPDTIKKLLEKCVQGLIEFDWDNQTYQQKIKDIYDIFETMEIKDVAYIKNLNTPKESTGFLSMEKGAGAHARAAEYYNQIINDMKLSAKYEYIMPSDRFHYIYIKANNKYGINVIGFKDRWPEEFNNIFEIDRIKMFEKTCLAPLDKIEENHSFSKFNPNNIPIANKAGVSLFDM